MRPCMIHERTMATTVDISNLTVTNDITKDLPSLQFESSISEDELSYLVLRRRSHSVTTSVCAQATYFAAILNRARQKIFELKNPPQSKSSKFLRDAPPRDPLLVGIIGGGRLGSHLAKCLLTFADVEPAELVISTRRPETLDYLTNQGVQCFYNNIQLLQTSHVVFLCILPSHLQSVAREVKGHIPKSCTIYSFLSSVPMPRIRRMLDFPCVVKADVTWNNRMETQEDIWDCTKGICETLENQKFVEMTCPLNLKEDDAVVSTDTKWADMVMYSLANMCTREGLTRDQTVPIINQTVLGHSKSREYPVKFTAYDFTRRRDLFPIFDMAAVATNETPITKTLNLNTDLRHQFVKQYSSIFDKFYYWKGIKQVKKKQEEEDQG